MVGDFFVGGAFDKLRHHDKLSAQALLKTF